MKTIALKVPDWEGHRAGQHIDIRLTAEDGYQAERSYSLASAPGPTGSEEIEITVERIEDGEVSPYLVDEVVIGDQIEIRGPIGGYFVWDTDVEEPLFLVGGGSGVVPLMAMLRHRVRSSSKAETKLLYSSRSIEDVIYQKELDKVADSNSGIEVLHTLTRKQPEGWKGYSRRVDAEMIAEAAWSSSSNPIAFICGPTAFVENVASLLVGLGYSPDRVKTERFGPSG